MPEQDLPPKPRLDRDGQQWFFDWMIQETGRTFHYQIDGRGRLPKSVRRHGMISKHVGKQARRMQTLAREEEGAGHSHSAMARYFDAANLFGQAQHPIFANTPEKEHLHRSSIECYDKVRELAPYRIEHLDFEWDQAFVSGNLHLLDTPSPAPLVFFVPGCDQTKEMFPHPHLNPAHLRGMHIFSFDGPGQGECNLRGIKLTASNYHEAASAVLDRLLERPEVDAERVVLFGNSFGSHWAMEIASHEPRFRAVAATWASFCDKVYLMNTESPRFKQLFMYLTGANTEGELDAITESMNLRPAMAQVTSPTLLVTGEYDPRAPLEEVYDMFDLLRSPAELWVLADQHHQASVTRPNSDVAFWQHDVAELALDWLADRISGRPLRDDHGVVYVDASRGGPYSPQLRREREWFR